MHRYNTTKPAVRVKTYGRHLQELVSYVASIPNKEEQRIYATQLVDIIKAISRHKKQKIDDHQAWADLFKIADYQLEIETPYPIERNPLKQSKEDTPITYNKKEIKFRCCGTYLIKLIDVVLKKLADNEQVEELIVDLVKTVQQIHKKRYGLSSTLEHIENVSGQKLPLSYEDLKKFFPQRSNHPAKKPHRFKQKRNKPSYNK